MSRSGSKYRDPYALDARKRKGGPHRELSKRQRIQELEATELDEELDWSELYDPQEWIQGEVGDDDSLV
jgi:hypothetical protein